MKRDWQFLTSGFPEQFAGACPCAERTAVLGGYQAWEIAGCEEALEKVMEMPIAYNNLFLADCSGTGILFETMMGEGYQHRTGG
ncbi:MAG: hypothetical protein ACLUOI_05310 [Eisenbergiella sp.]